MASKIRKLTVKYSSLLFLFILLPFFVDQVQGFLKLVVNIGFPFSLLVKAVIISIMFGYLVWKKRLPEITFLMFLFFILILSVVTDEFFVG